MNDCAMPIRRLNCTIPVDQFKELVEMAKFEDRTQSNILKRLIHEAYLKGDWRQRKG
jgi:hypothetical protein